ncbi:hypothetical protein NEIRO03_2379 [Nematocida sp. AWRm78]|nr:hypothetical protein NEIRO02_2417 [Nematocida sp. AWRm79]KAI5186771.1 hypothetical protein NEIRO03_2379 [Nematocida sp. AWRm78]
MEDRYTPFKRKQFILSTILTRRNIIALLLLIQTIYTQVEISDANEIHQITFGNKYYLMVVNPGWGLSPILNHIESKCGYLQNMRNYLLHIIDAESICKKDDITRLGKCINYLSNSIYIDKITYLKIFNQQLVNMFPSEKGYLSIESENPDSFTRFLRGHKNTQDVLYILASLFLLSEGMKIPIEIVNDPKEGNRLVLVNKKEKKEGEKNSGDVFYINSPMVMLDEKGVPVYHQKTEDIVNFFKGIGYGSIRVPTEFLHNNPYKSLSDGNLLCNPIFLIQSYFFEYINTAGMYKRIAEIMYELLDRPSCIYGDDYELTWSPTRRYIIRKFFMIKNNYYLRISSLPRYIKHLRDIEKVCNDLYSQMPSVHKEVHSMHYPIPSYIRRKDRNIVTEDNYIEHLLFNLFVCFTFNQYTNRQTTSHLPSPSSHLVEFFDKNKCKIQSEDSTLRSDWCKMVLGNLSAENVFYTEEKNKIEFGLLNMLYAIKGLAGTNKELEVAINCVDGIIKKKRIDESDQAEIKESLQEAFKSLSLNKSIEVECESLKLIKTFSGRADIFTDENTSIVVSYSEYPFHSYRRLEIEMPHFIFDFTVVPTTPTEENTVDFNSINTQLCNMKEGVVALYSYIKWHIDQYLDIVLDKIAYVLDKEYTFTNKIALAMKSGYKSVPKNLLVIGDLDCIVYKAKIVEVFLIHSSTETLDITNPMVKFTSKLIDSVPLDDLRVRKIMLRGCLYNKNFGLYYPQIKYDVEEVLEPYKDSASAMLLIENLFSLDISLLAITNSFASLATLLKRYKSNKEKYFIFGSEQVSQKIIKKLSENKEDNADIKTILNTIRSCTDAMGDYCADNIFMGWLLHIGSLDENILILVFITIYDYIDTSNLTENVKALLRSKNIGHTIKSAVSLLLDNKSEIMKGEEDLSFKTGKYHKMLRFTRSLCSSEYS